MNDGAWASDPTGRHELRWWDGGRWTDRVANQGVVGFDAFGSNIPPPPTQPTEAATRSSPDLSPESPTAGHDPGFDHEPEAVLEPYSRSVLDLLAECLTRYGDFSGRASRPEYFAFHAFALLAGLAMPLSFGFLGLETLGGLVLILVFLWLLVPTASVGVRRLHDIGLSGWWLLIGVFPLVGPLVLLALATVRGNPRPNEYGPPPGAT